MKRLAKSNSTICNRNAFTDQKSKEGKNVMVLNRREFLETSVPLAAASAGLSAFGPFQAGAAPKENVSPTEVIRCGVIGVGGRGSGLAHLLGEHGHSLVTAVCDVHTKHGEGTAHSLKETQNHRPKVFSDFRRLLDDEAIDAVVVATPHHWHTPIALRALEAGKHVYVEKPASHVFREGRLLIEAARKADRVVQHGTQMRSSEVTLAANEVLQSGRLGEIKMARAWSVEPRRHPQAVADEEPPEFLDWNMWLGPAPKHPFNRLRVGRWRWFRDYGNGEIGDDGVHDIDLGRWGLGADEHPVRISATGGRIDLEGVTQFPNHMTVSYQYADGRELVYETRNWAPYKMQGFDSGNAFYGTEGYMIFSRRGYFQTYFGPREEKGPGMRGGGGGKEHMHNFLQAIRQDASLNADVETAHLSAGLVHLGEIAYRTGRALQFDPEKETFPQDGEAEEMLTKEYRSPWTV